VYISQNSTFTMSGGTIANNTAKGFGGGVYFYSGNPQMSSGKMSGGTISGNIGADGGGVYIDIRTSAGTFEMSSGIIANNTARGGGGGVYVSSGTFEMSGGTIANNTAKGFGGGVYVTARDVTLHGMFEMSSGTISGNTAMEYGGGVFIDGTFELSGTATISDNTAARGGDVYLMEGKTFNMSGTAAVGPDTTHLTSGTFINVTQPLTGGGGVQNITVDNTAVGTRVVQLHNGETAEYLGKFTLNQSIRDMGLILVFNDSINLVSPYGISPLAASVDAPVLELAAAPSYNVTVIGGSGSGSYTAGKLVSITAIPDTGYTFREWQVVSGGIATPASATATFTMPANDVTVKAVFTPNSGPHPTPTVGGGNTEDSFRVLFDTKGGSSIPPTTGLSYGDRVPKPADPVRDGYTFGGWYLDEDGTKAWNFADTILGDMTLYAKWVSTATPTPTAAQDLQPTAQPTGDESTARPTTEPPQPTGDEGSKPAGGILPLLGGILILILILLIILILFLRHTVTFLIPATGGIEQYRVKVWHGKLIDVDKLPGYLRTAGWYRDQERNDAWDFEEDRVRKSIELYLG